MSRRKNKRRGGEEEHENHERWLVSYADFITLLFAFFVILYATAEKNKGKEKEFEESVKKHFAAVMGSFGSVGPVGEMLKSFVKDNATVNFPGAGSGPEEVKDHVERKLRKEIRTEDFDHLIDSIESNAMGVKIRMTSSVLFHPGSAQLQHRMIRDLSKVGDLLKRSNRRIIIEGHTDNEPIASRQFPSNWELASARATTVLRYLAKVHKIEENNMVAISYGKTQPISTNDTVDGRERNRRIEILIVTGQSPI